MSGYTTALCTGAICAVLTLAGGSFLFAHLLDLKSRGDTLAREVERLRREKYSLELQLSKQRAKGRTP